MNKPFSQRQVAKFFANTASFILAAGIILSLFPVGAVSAYVTKGANGRSLGLAPGFYIERNLMAPAGTLCRSGQLPIVWCYLQSYILSAAGGRHNEGYSRRPRNCFHIRAT